MREAAGLDLVVEPVLGDPEEGAHFLRCHEFGARIHLPWPGGFVAGRVPDVGDRRQGRYRWGGGACCGVVVFVDSHVVNVARDLHHEPHQQYAVARSGINGLAVTSGVMNVDGRSMARGHRRPR